MPELAFFLIVPLLAGLVKEALIYVERLLLNYSFEYWLVCNVNTGDVNYIMGNNPENR